MSSEFAGFRKSKFFLTTVNIMEILPYNDDDNNNDIEPMFSKNNIIYIIYVVFNDFFLENFVY
jgi:hypothetical protein